ncbi:flavin reductase family protein [Sphingomonas oligophenolica]|uniref:Flavin reductase family protein n=1 Tax=Sphingomonas oligophenolica TaxID=301154 RepID=A0ABU9YBP0_9SPHN
MGHIAASEQDILSNYKLLTGLVVPRPIAWVTTLGEAGQVNLAPFSAFTFLSSAPPIIGIGIGGHKDTAVNIARTGEFVVHIASMAFLEPLHQSSIEHPPEVSEVDLLGLATVPSRMVAVPTLAGIPAALECKLHRVSDYGRLNAKFIAGEVVSFFVRDDLLREGKVQTSELDPLARLAGPSYSGIGEPIVKQPLNPPPRERPDPAIAPAARTRGISRRTTP